MTTADEVVGGLGLISHPEGGWYRETWRGSAPPGTRPSGSAIVYLLGAGERSHWHRVDADEIWQFSAGDQLELRVWAEGQVDLTVHHIGPGLGGGDTIQAVVPAGAWQAARSLGAWTLVGCIVTPAFEFDGFELAPPGWEPPVGGPPD
jgi:uncharacterized protein